MQVSVHFAGVKTQLLACSHRLQEKAAKSMAAAVAAWVTYAACLWSWGWMDSSPDCHFLAATDTNAYRRKTMPI